jgi:putative methyltransferase (TIGR04325 family)
MLAPIILFTYNRLEHLTQSIAALKKNKLAKESKLFIFSDGPKNNSDNEKINKLREYIKTIKGFATIKVVKRNKNIGLAKSITSGVTEIINKYGKVIVLEDDLIISPYFLKYMNDALELYENNKKVISIHGYIYPLKTSLPETFFLKGADCWGWATWKRGWDLFDKNGKKLLSKIQKNNLANEFNFNNTYPYLEMLQDRVNGLNNSWAILWYASAFLKNKLTLYPGKSLVQNIGLDNSGTHSKKSDKYKGTLFLAKLALIKINVKENILAKNKIKHFFNKIRNRKRFLSLFNRIKIWLKIYYNIFKKTLKLLLPPLLVKTLKLLKRKKYGWFGNYPNWAKAIIKCKGYGANNIVGKVKNSLLQVKNGIAVYERDSVIFTEKQYSWPLLASLLWIAKENNEKLNVIDFGGSLGSSYFQNNSFLNDLKKFTWNIVEQDNFVKLGKKHFEDKHLKFYRNIESCLNKNTANVILLSSVIQYLANPYQKLKEILSLGIKYIIIDRTAFIKGSQDRLTIQKVPPDIYEASYPAWFLNENKLLNLFSKDYELISDFASKDKANIPDSYFKGFIFKKC